MLSHIKKLKKLNRLITVAGLSFLSLSALCETAAASVTITQQSDDLARLNDTLPHGKLIDSLLLKYEIAKGSNNKKDKKGKSNDDQAVFFLTASAEQGSGLANLILAREDNVPFNKKINYYLQAAKYGYPSEGYQAIADIYQNGLGVENDDFLASCYRNLATYNSNKPLVEVCKSRYPDKFRPMPNMPLQSAKEIMKKAQTDYALFCDNFNEHNLFNPLLDKNEQKILAQLLCHPENKTINGQLKIGDIVLKEGDLFKYTNEGYMAYTQKMQNGTPVYRINPPISLYIYKEGQLKPTQNGDKIVKDGKPYIVKDNRLSDFNPNA
jgi:TPR repeat protein